MYSLCPESCFFSTQYFCQAICTQEPRRDPSNRRLNEHGIYIRHCQESNSQLVPSQAGADTTRPQWRIVLIYGTETGIIYYGEMDVCGMSLKDRSEVRICGYSVAGVVRRTWQIEMDWACILSIWMWMESVLSWLSLEKMDIFIINGDYGDEN